jgi:hypothetical protein
LSQITPQATVGHFQLPSEDALPDPHPETGWVSRVEGKGAIRYGKSTPSQIALGPKRLIKLLDPRMIAIGSPVPIRESEIWITKDPL